MNDLEPRDRRLLHLAEEAIIRTLPMYQPSFGSDYESTPIVLGPFEGTIELVRGAVEQPVPDHTNAHWLWPDAGLLLQVAWNSMNLYPTKILERWPRCTYHMQVNNHPMSLGLANAETTYIAHIDGYLDDGGSLCVRINAGDATKRDALIAGLTTMRLVYKGLPRGV